MARYNNGSSFKKFAMFLGIMTFSMCAHQNVQLSKKDDTHLGNSKLASFTKEQKTQRLLMVMNTQGLGQQMADQLIAIFQKMPAYANIPAEVWVDVKKEIDSSDITQKLVPIYNNNLDEDTIEQLIYFYESPAGQKFLASQPQIVKDSTAAGEAWGKEMAIRMMEKLKQKNH